MSRCIRCGHWIFWLLGAHYGFWIRRDGSEVKWHAAHDVRPTP